MFACSLIKSWFCFVGQIIKVEGLDQIQCSTDALEQQAHMLENQFRPHAWPVVSCWFLLQASIQALKALNEMNADLEDEPKQKKPKGTTKGTRRYIVPIVGNFKRTKQGRALMEQECRKLIELQATKFPAKSMVDIDNKTITYSYNGTSGAISMTEFLLKAPVFFDNYFVSVRKKVEFGAKVHSWITDVTKEMTKDYRFKRLQEFRGWECGFQMLSGEII